MYNHLHLFFSHFRTPSSSCGTSATRTSSSSTWTTPTSASSQPPYYWTMTPLQQLISSAMLLWLGWAPWRPMMWTRTLQGTRLVRIRKSFITTSLLLDYDTIATADKFGNVAVVRMGSLASDDVDEDPIGNKVGYS